MCVHVCVCMCMWERDTHSISSLMTKRKPWEGLPWWLSGRESACQCRRHGFNPLVRKIPWRRKWQGTLVFLPGKSHRQRSLKGCSPWGHKRVAHNLATKPQLKGSMTLPEWAWDLDTLMVIVLGEGNSHWRHPLENVLCPGLQTQTQFHFQFHG